LLSALRALETGKLGLILSWVIPELTKRYRRFYHFPCSRA